MPTRSPRNPQPRTKTRAKPKKIETPPTAMLWKGPESTDLNGGITASMLSKFIVCRERFRLYTVYGYKAEDEFDHKIEFGNFWHHAKETWRAKGDWKKAVETHKNYLLSTYPAAEKDIIKWAYLAAGCFRVWLSLPGKFTQTTQILEEVPFKVPYQLPSGRTVILRGKYDSIVAKGKRLYIEDDKSKGFIDDAGISATIHGVLQMGFYHTAARQSLTYAGKRPSLTNLNNSTGYIDLSGSSPYKFAGTIYNIVRRPLAERNPIRKRKAETDKKFWDRVIEGVRKEPAYYFIPKTAEVPEVQIARFQQRVLNPYLESLCLWYDWIEDNPDDPWRNRSIAIGTPEGIDTEAYGIANFIHYQTPWGVFNSLFGGFRGDYFDFLTKGTDNGLRRVSTLFPELE